MLSRSAHVRCAFWKSFSTTWKSFTSFWCCATCVVRPSSSLLVTDCARRLTASEHSFATRPMLSRCLLSLPRSSLVSFPVPSESTARLNEDTLVVIWKMSPWTFFDSLARSSPAPPMSTATSPMVLVSHSRNEFRAVSND